MGGQGSVTTGWDRSRGAAGPQERTKPQCKAWVTKTRGELWARSRAACRQAWSGHGPTQHTMCSSTCPCMPVHSLTHDPCAHSQCACTHTDTYQPKLDTASAHLKSCSPEKRLSRNLLPALASLLHPSRYLWGKGWSSGERRAEVRGQQSPIGQPLFGDPQAPGQAPAFLSRKMSKEVGEGPGC